MEEIKVTEWHQMTLDEYVMAKEEIKRRLNSMANDYIYIGYQLRKIQESEAYRQDGYETLAEFAKKEYGLSESATSRFIAINTKFSIGGYSSSLLPDFENFGSSKLSEMLTLSDEDCRLIKETTTVATIRDIKKFNKEEHAEETVQADVVTETFVKTEESERKEQKENIPQEPVKQGKTEEKTLAASQEAQGQQWDGIRKVIVEFFRDKKGLLNYIYELDNFEDIADRINPSGNLTFRKGLYMLFLYPYAEGVALKTFAKPNETYTWPEFIKIIAEVFGTTYTVPGKIWEDFYGEEKQEEKTVEGLVKSTKNDISGTCDVASEEKSGNASKIKENQDFEEENPEPQEKQIEEKPASPSKIKKKTDCVEENEQIEGQKEIEDYFDQEGNYKQPEVKEENTQEISKASVRHRNAQIMVYSNGGEIQRGDCIDEVINIVCNEISRMVAEGFDAEITFVKKGE